MAKYAVNDAAVHHAHELIDARRYVLRNRWADVQPAAANGTRTVAAERDRAVEAGHERGRTREQDLGYDAGP
jgi:hypothetical protein